MSSPFAYHRLIVGYHGCDRATFEAALLRDEPLKPSDNPYDWLGQGVYFWEHGPRRALEFAKWKQARGEIEEPAVLGAYIHLGRCFDLTDTSLYCPQEFLMYEGIDPPEVAHKKALERL